MSALFDLLAALVIVEQNQVLLAKDAEVYEAFGIPRATYYDHLAKRRLTSADNLIHAARHFGINPVDRRPMGAGVAGWR